MSVDTPSARAAHAVLALSILVVLLVLAAPPALAAAGSGANELVAGPVVRPAVPGSYSPPVDRPVVDPFRMDAGPYGPGNRGLEYGTLRGDPVRAVAAGRVAFAGPVAGRLVLSIDHPDGRRSSLTNMASLDVARGDVVTQGTPVGTAATHLHLGVREGRTYIDPQLLFVTGRRRAVLVPLATASAG